jgi:hypothetical protein
MDDIQYEIEREISDRVIKMLKLPSLSYTYKSKTYKVPMRICVVEFLEGLTLDSDIGEALKRTAINGPYNFKWWVGYWSLEKEKKAQLNNPSWGELFELADNAYIDGGCVDHHFLEGFNCDIHSGDYQFFFGS